MSIQRFIYLVFSCLGVSLYTQTVAAQDLHFSQYFNAPLLVNPANTGFNPDFDYRLGGNYRNQWSTISNNPYKTMSVWADAQLLNNKLDNGWLGVGGMLVKDEAGAGSLSATKAVASIAYHQLLGYKSLLSGGFSVGLTQKRVDPTKLTFNSQWNGKFFDITVPSSEPILYSSVTYFTINAGVNYAYFVNDNVYLNVGASLSNINRPRESFYDQTRNDDRLQQRITTFANASIRAGDAWIINPNLYYSNMANASELVLGVMAQRDLSAEHNGSLQLLAGAYYRLNDAAIPMVGFDVKGFTFTLNYDATISSLNQFNQSRGAYEISVVKNGLYGKGDKSLKCPPRVRF